MEISNIKNQKSTAFAGSRTKPTEKTKQEIETESAQTVEEKKTPANDKCDLSDEAKAFLKKQQEFVDEKSMFLEFLCQQRAQEKKSNDSLAKSLKVRLQCLKIAAQIKKGNKVNGKDLQFLLKHDHQLYMLAMVSKKHNDDPKKVKRISKEDKEENPCAIYLPSKTQSDTIETISTKQES